MSKTTHFSEDAASSSIRFSHKGLALFSVGLMAATFFFTTILPSHTTPTTSTAKRVVAAPGTLESTLITRKGPWGELVLEDIKLKRPVEYIAKEANDPEAETWTFNNMNPAQVQTLLASRGFTKDQVDTQTAPNHITMDGTTTLLKPDEDFLLSLTTETRAKLYNSLFGIGLGSFFDFPMIYPSKSIETVYRAPELNSDDVRLLKQLVYSSSNSDRLSDYNLLLRKIPTAERRMMMAKALSIQPAVLARLRVTSDSDIEKIATYWGNMENVRFTDLRPMLEALKAQPNGSSVSLMYFLPPFARTRLYTYPLPIQSGATHLDCHWSTFNFSSLEPDNRYNDPRFLSDSIKQNYYQIEAPSRYGDVIIYLDDKDHQAKHSGLFLADDLAFTKYGDNYHQPWMIVHLSDMQAVYPMYKPMFFRRKTQ